MKRMALIAVLLLILALLPAALADTQPSVSFTTNQITAQCGNTVTLTLAANAAPSRDITINITDERGNPFPVVLRQGETRATLQVTTARAGYNKRYEPFSPAAIISAALPAAYRCCTRALPWGSFRRKCCKPTWAKR